MIFTLLEVVTSSMWIVTKYSFKGLWRLVFGRPLTIEEKLMIEMSTMKEHYEEQIEEQKHQSDRMEFLLEKMDMDTREIISTLREENLKLKRMIHIEEK